MFAIIETGTVHGTQTYSESFEEYDTEAEAAAAVARNYANYACNQGDNGLAIRWHVEQVD